jgi:hypothetical protein
MCSNPALSQHVLTTYHTTFCEMPLPHTFPILATARKILPSVTPAASVHWSRAALTQFGIGLDGSLNPSVTLSFMKTKAKVSKQRRWQIAKLEAGRCAICGKKRKHYKYHCDPCQEKHRKAKRRLTGNKPYSGSKGIAPFVKDKNPGHPRRVRGGR